MTIVRGLVVTGSKAILKQEGVIMKVGTEVKVTEIAFVCYPVTDLKRAREFCEGILGMKETRVFGDETMGMIEYDIGTGTFALGVGAPQFKPSAGGGCAALEVEDFEATVERLKDEGCKFVVEPADCKSCSMAVVSDPDGNSLIVHKRH
jgi:predicted enzyme related to lactoylglutathione lyase